MLFFEDDASFSTFASPMQRVQDDCIFSDHLLQDLMPDLSTQSVEECLGLPKVSTQMSLDEYDCYPLDPIRQQEPNTMLSGRIRAFSYRQFNSSTLTNVDLPPQIPQIPSLDPGA